MTFLLDENLALSYAEALHDIGINAIHVIDVGLHQTKDEDIVDFARNNKQVIITFDLDHTRIVAMSGNQLPSIITFRVMQFSNLGICCNCLASKNTINKMSHPKKFGMTHL